MSWLSRLTNVFRSGRLDRDLKDELQFHIEARTEDLIRQGMSPTDATQEARRRFGSQLALRDSSRDTKLLPWLESLMQDARFGLRTLRKDHAVTVAAVVTLSLAIGACTAAFSLIDALLLRPLRLPNPQNLVDLSYPRLRVAFPGAPTEDDRFSYPLFEHFRTGASGQVDLFGITMGTPFQSVIFDGARGEAEQVRAQWISANGLRILGVRPAVGRLLMADDERTGAHSAAVLSYAFWVRRFGGDPSILGRWVEWDGRQFQIVGIAQKGFSGVEPGSLTDLWLPLTTWASAAQLSDPGWSEINVAGRLKTGGASPHVQQVLQAAFTNFRRERAHSVLPSGTSPGEVARFIRTRLNIRSAAHGHQTFAAWQFARPLWILAVVVSLVLLITCSNLANLFIARATARGREMAMRAAIGAGRRRLVQQLLIESSMLTCTACVIGLGFASVMAPVIVGLLQRAEDPIYLDVQPDGRVLAFVALLGIVTTLLFGAAPALRASGIRLNDALKASGGGHSARIGFFKPVLGVQVGFSFVVLFVAGLLLSSFQRLTSVDLGFSKEGVVLFSMDLATPEHGNKERAVALELLDRLRSFPGVLAASTSLFPLMGGAYVPVVTPGVRVPGHERDSLRPQYLSVSPGFFATMQIRLLAGREFAPRDTDRDTPTAVIVNQSFAQHYFPSEDPLGGRFERIDEGGHPVPQEIVGLVRDAKHNNLREPPTPTVYEPVMGVGTTVEVRTAGNPLAIAPALRQTIQQVHPTLHVIGVTLQSTRINETILSERLLAFLSGFFAVIAVVLAAVGLYSVLSYSVIRRTKEIGIRIALGAQRLAVARIILADFTVAMAVGVAAGMAVGFSLTGLVAPFLFEVKPSDFWSLTLPLSSFLSASILAALSPAIRAAHVDPMAALRYE